MARAVLLVGGGGASRVGAEGTCGADLSFGGGYGVGTVRGFVVASPVLVCTWVSVFS